MKNLLVAILIIASLGLNAQWKEFKAGYYSKGDTVQVTSKNSVYVAYKNVNATAIPTDNTNWVYVGNISYIKSLKAVEQKLSQSTTDTEPPTPPAPTDRKNIVFQDLDGSATWDRYCYGTPITTTTIGGKSAKKFTVNKTDAICAGGLRAEVNRWIESASYPYEVWYGMSYYVPSDWVFDQPTLFDIVNQWHDEGGSLKSPFDFSINGSKWRYQVRSNDISGIEKGVDFSTVEKGVWTDFVFHLKFVKSGFGIVEIWKNGVKVVTDNTPMGWSTATSPPFFKMGIYKWPWNPQDLACCGATNSISHTVYISNFRLGNKDAGYDNVKP